MRSKSAGEGGELTIRTEEPTRSAEHFSRLLNEHLAKTELPSSSLPSATWSSRAIDVQPLEETSASLLPDTVHQGESPRQVLERISARLGPERMVRPVVTEDHRLEWAQYCKRPDIPWDAPTRSEHRATAVVDFVDEHVV